MKKITAFVLSAVLTVMWVTAGASALGRSDIVSEAAVLMDAATGQVLFAKNQDKRMYPASTTKIMTCLLVTELCDPDSVATVSASALDIDEWDSANISLVQGEKMRVDDLIYGMMLPSANDAANVLAEQAAKSQAEFARLMTARAAALGAVNTSFTNAHGLHGDAHYTTARDMALITREAIKSPAFMKYFRAPKHTVPPTNLNPYERVLTNYQYMLVPDSGFYDPQVLGGKIGFTSEARHTMSTVKARDGRVLIAVVFASPDRDGKFTDTKKLFDFGMNEFISVHVTDEMVPGFEAEISGKNGDAGSVSFKLAENSSLLLHKSVSPGDIAMVYSDNGPFYIDGGFEASASFSADYDNPAIPKDLATVRLAFDAEYFVPVTEPGEGGGSSFASVFGNRLFIPGICLSASVFCLVMVFAARRRKRKKALERRQRRAMRMANSK